MPTVFSSALKQNLFWTHGAANKYTSNYSWSYSKLVLKKINHLLWMNRPLRQLAYLGLTVPRAEMKRRVRRVARQAFGEHPSCVSRDNTWKLSRAAAVVLHIAVAMDTESILEVHFYHPNITDHHYLCITF